MLQCMCTGMVRVRACTGVYSGRSGSWRYTLKDGPRMPRATSLLDPKPGIKGAVLHKSTESVIPAQRAQMCHKIGEKSPSNWGTFEAHLRYIWSIFEALLGHYWGIIGIQMGFWWGFSRIMLIVPFGHYCLFWTFPGKSPSRRLWITGNVQKRAYFHVFCVPEWPFLTLFADLIVPSGHFWKHISRDFLNSLNMARR